MAFRILYSYIAMVRIKIKKTQIRFKYVMRTLLENEQDSCFNVHLPAYMHSKLHTRSAADEQGQYYNGIYALWCFTRMQSRGLKLLSYRATVSAGFVISFPSADAFGLENKVCSLLRKTVT